MSLGWDYPAGAEHDPRAPWNERDHYSSCPAHEDAEPKCAECGRPMNGGDCWLYTLWPFYGRGFFYWDEICRSIARMKWVAGRFPSYCNELRDPDCECTEIDADNEASRADAWEAMREDR